MHVEAAKLLAFTEDEFVKTLELGDKMWVLLTLKQYTFKSNIILSFNDGFDKLLFQFVSKITIVIF